MRIVTDEYFLLYMQQKHIVHTNIDKTMKIKMIKSLQTSTNNWQQKLLSSLMLFDIIDEYSRNIEEIVIPSEKPEETLNKFREVL